jgi:hypothetical protein
MLAAGNGRRRLQQPCLVCLHGWARIQLPRSAACNALLAPLRLGRGWQRQCRRRGNGLRSSCRGVGERGCGAALGGSSRWKAGRVQPVLQGLDLAAHGLKNSTAREARHQRTLPVAVPVLPRGYQQFALQCPGAEFLSRERQERGLSTGMGANGSWRKGQAPYRGSEAALQFAEDNALSGLRLVVDMQQARLIHLALPLQFGIALCRQVGGGSERTQRIHAGARVAGEGWGCSEARPWAASRSACRSWKRRCRRRKAASTAASGCRSRHPPASRAPQSKPTHHPRGFLGEGIP